MILGGTRVDKGKSRAVDSAALHGGSSLTNSDEGPSPNRSGSHTLSVDERSRSTERIPRHLSGMGSDMPRPSPVLGPPDPGRSSIVREDASEEGPASDVIVPPVSSEAGIVIDSVDRNTPLSIHDERPLGPRRPSQIVHGVGLGIIASVPSRPSPTRPIPIPSNQIQPSAQSPGSRARRSSQPSWTDSDPDLAPSTSVPQNYRPHREESNLNARIRGGASGGPLHAPGVGIGPASNPNSNVGPGSSGRGKPVGLQLPSGIVNPLANAGAGGTGRVGIGSSGRGFTSTRPVLRPGLTSRSSARTIHTVSSDATLEADKTSEVKDRNGILHPRGSAGYVPFQLPLTTSCSAVEVDSYGGGQSSRTRTRSTSSISESDSGAEDAQGNTTGTLMPARSPFGNNTSAADLSTPMPERSNSGDVIVGIDPGHDGFGAEVGPRSPARAPPTLVHPHPTADPSGPASTSSATAHSAGSSRPRTATTMTARQRYETMSAIESTWAGEQDRQGFARALRERRDGWATAYGVSRVASSIGGLGAPLDLDSGSRQRPAGRESDLVSSFEETGEPETETERVEGNGGSEAGEKSRSRSKPSPRASGSIRSPTSPSNRHVVSSLSPTEKDETRDRDMTLEPLPELDFLVASPTQVFPRSPQSVRTSPISASPPRFATAPKRTRSHTSPSDVGCSSTFRDHPLDPARGNLRSTDGMTPLQSTSEMLGRLGMSPLLMGTPTQPNQVIHDALSADWYFDPSGARSLIRQRGETMRQDNRGTMDQDIVHSLFGKATSDAPSLVLSGWAQEVARPRLQGRNVSSTQSSWLGSMSPSSFLRYESEDVNEAEADDTAGLSDWTRLDSQLGGGGGGQPDSGMASNTAASATDVTRRPSPAPSSTASSRTAGPPSVITSVTSVETRSTPPTSDPPTSASIALSYSNKSSSGPESGSLDPSKVSRTSSRKMPWDMALYSAAPPDEHFRVPQRRVIEESLERAGYAMSGSGRITGHPADINVIEQAFTAAMQIASVSLATESSPVPSPLGYHEPPVPESPSTATSSSRSSDRFHRFRSYHGPGLPEIERAGGVFFDPFALAFGNGGDKSRDSLTQTKKKHDAARKESKAARRAMEPRTSSPRTRPQAVAEIDSDPTMRHSDARIGLAQGVLPHRRSTESSTPLPSPSTLSSIRRLEHASSDGGTLRHHGSTASVGSDNTLIRPPSTRGLSETALITVPQGLFPPSGGMPRGPRVQNVDDLKPHGTFTSARRPSTFARAEARASQAKSDERFDAIRHDQLLSAAHAGDQLAEAHLRSRRYGGAGQDSWRSERLRLKRTSSPTTSRSSRRNRSSVGSGTDFNSADGMPAIPENTCASLSRHIDTRQQQREESNRRPSAYSDLDSNCADQSRRSSDSSSVRAGKTALDAIVDVASANPNDLLPIKLRPLSPVRPPRQPRGPKARSSCPNSTPPTLSSSSPRVRTPTLAPPPPGSADGDRRAAIAAFSQPSSELFADVARMAATQNQKDRARENRVESIRTQTVERDAESLRYRRAQANGMVEPEVGRKKRDSSSRPISSRSASTAARRLRPIVLVDCPADEVDSPQPDRHTAEERAIERQARHDTRKRQAARLRHVDAEDSGARARLQTDDASVADAGRGGPAKASSEKQDSALVHSE